MQCHFSSSTQPSEQQHWLDRLLPGARSWLEDQNRRFASGQLPCVETHIENSTALQMVVAGTRSPVQVSTVQAIPSASLSHVAEPVLSCQAKHRANWTGGLVAGEHRGNIPGAGCEARAPRL